MIKNKVILFSFLCLIFISSAGGYVLASERMDLLSNIQKALSFYNTHTAEKLTSIYYKKGSYQRAALNDINLHLRDHRQNEITPINTNLLDLLYEIKTQLQSRYPEKDIVFHVISGYRSPATNEMLRKTRGGQGKKSRHMHGDAIDIRVPGIPTKEIRDIAWCLQKGGVGYYSGNNFVHVDTSRVRFWNWVPRVDMCKYKTNS
jgi:uncharacterized protein YcbK (DUF882 family)